MSVAPSLCTLAESFLRCLSVAGRRVDALKRSVHVFCEIISNELSADSSPDVVQLREMQLLRSLALKCDVACPTANKTNVKGLQFVTGLSCRYELLIARSAGGWHCKWSEGWWPDRGSQHC